MTGQTPRPVALDVLAETIPAELKALPIWTCWRYEWNEKRGAWAKSPYMPYTVKHASSTRPSSWASFERAYACYQERRDFFDGVFIALSKDDPYVGGDFDHGCAGDRVPDTYAEFSPTVGKDGVRFIGRGTIPAACKKPDGELYSRARFLSITGHKLPNAPATIRPIQPELDALYEALKGRAARAVKDGTAGDGDRAQLAKDIPDSEWEAGRLLVRTQIDRLLARVRAAAGEETQLAYLLRGDYAGFHQKWSFVGLYRSDGTLDDSQVRAVAAAGIKGRGFTFPEYAALMSHIYAAKALEKWGTKELWRQELAALWAKMPGPQRAFVRQEKPRRDVIKPRPRGRANVHAATVEQVYTLLVERRAGTGAIVQIGELASAVGVHRRTITSILDELRAAGRITSRRNGQYGGLVVTFSDVIIPAAQAAVSPAAMPEIDVAPPAVEETKTSKRVSSDRAEADHISEPPSMAALAEEYLSLRPTAIGKRIVNADGVVTYRRTKEHFADLVAEHYGREDAFEAYRAEQARRAELARQEWQRYFARLKAMTNDDLITFVASGLQAEIGELMRRDGVFDKRLYKTRRDCALNHLAWRGLELPAKPTRSKPVTPRRKAEKPAAVEQRPLTHEDRIRMRREQWLASREAAPQ